MKKPSFRTFIQNLYSLWVYDYHQQDLELRKENQWQQKNLRWLKIQNAALKAAGTSEDCPEMAFIRNCNELTNFPYPQLKHLDSVTCAYDIKLKLPFVLHNGKKLYFPKTFSLEACEQAYRSLIEKDQILGGGYLEKAPHCYQTDSFKVEERDVLFDCGAAEGLFALDAIDKVSHVYLIETDKTWIPALEATFAPYNEKVTIVNKFLSDKNDYHNVNLATLLSKHNDQCFVKIDIEGAEVNVIKACKDYLKTRDNIRLACCAYHYQQDAEKLSRMFEDIGYQYEFSDGWMLCMDFEEVKSPYLRHGIIKVQKFSQRRF